MSVTYGFYNGLEHDRLYDAIQMSSIFDGIIRDGIFSTIGTSLICHASGSGMIVNVGIGRAWFNHTWTLNDSIYPIEAEQAEVVLDRIDAVVLEVNEKAEVRANSIKFVKGTPSSNPERPTLINDLEVHQYALAYVHIRPSVDTIAEEDITNVVGTDETPFVTGILQQLSIEQLITQWEADFATHFANWEAINEQEYLDWTTARKNEYNNWIGNQMTQYAAWFAQMQDDMSDDFAEFDAWFQRMKDQLSTDAAGHLQAEIDAIMDELQCGSIITIHAANQSLAGKNVTITDGTETVTQEFDNNLIAVFNKVSLVGHLTISSTDGVQTATSYVDIDYFSKYEYTIAFWASTVNLTTSSPELYSADISVYKDDVLIDTIAFNAVGRCTYVASSPGTYRFACTYEGETYDAIVSVQEEGMYQSAIINIWTATLNITTSSTELYGNTITIKDSNNRTVGTTYFSLSGEATFKVHEADTYSLNTVYDGETYTEYVTVVEEITYNVALDSCPDGSTVTPTDDIQTWLKCAKIKDKPYTTMEEVLTDHEALQVLIDSENAVNYMVRSKTFIKGNTLVPTLTADDGNTLSSTPYNVTTYPAWKAFDGDINTSFISQAAQPAYAYVGYTFSSAKSVSKVEAYLRQDLPSEFIVQGSNDGFVSDVHDLTNTIAVAASAGMVTAIVDNSTQYTSYRIYGRCTKTTSNYSFEVKELQFYASITIGITEDSTAMRYIGKRNYASNTLLGDEDWFNAIVNSDYWKQVINKSIPLMTDATHPSGVVTCDSTYSSNYCYEPMGKDAVDSVNFWQSSTGSGGIHWIAYDFEKDILPIRTFYTFCHNGTTSHNITAKMQGLDGEGNWVDLTEPATTTNSNKEISQVLSTQSKFRKFRIYFTLTNANLTADLWAWNIHYREDVDETVIDIYSAANDTVYYVENGSNVTLATTDSSGHATIAKSNLPSGKKTLYSTVAKNPESLNDPFSKEFKMENNPIEIAVMPGDPLYWYGFKDSNLENISTANGWSVSSGSFIDPTYNTGNVLCDTSSGAVRYSGVGTKGKIVKYKGRLNAVAQGVTAASSTYGNVTIYKDGKTFLNANYESVTEINNSSVKKYMNTPACNRKNFYASAYASIGGTSGRRSFTLYGLWISTPNPMANLFSAANDTVYYMNDNLPVVVAKTDEFGGAVANLASIPAGVTLYSSVADDPTNLSNSYSKQFTLASDGKFYLMPDNAFYWYGYINDMEDAVAVNGYSTGSGTSILAPTKNANDIYTSPAASQFSLEATKYKVLSGKIVKAIMDCTAINYNEGSVLEAYATKNFGDGTTYIIADKFTAVSGKSLKSITLPSDGYVVAGSINGRAGHLYALWYE